MMYKIQMSEIIHDAYQRRAIFPIVYPPFESRPLPAARTIVRKFPNILYCKTRANRSEPAQQRQQPAAGIFSGLQK
jgi:hypothetical protein